jgi:hypothetical protein
MKTSLLLTVLVSALAGGAHAQSLEDRLRAQLVTVTAQLHDLQAKQAAQPSVSTDETQLQSRLAAAETEIRTLKRRGPAAPTKAATAGLQAQIAALTQAKTADEAALATEREWLAKANTALQQREAENRQIQALQASDVRDLEACRAKSVQALQVARDLLKAYRQVSVADVLARKEPVTGIARTRIEQIEQGYADQIYQSRLDAAPTVPAQQTPASAASPKP